MVRFNEDGEGLTECFAFFLAAEYIIEADRLYLEAHQMKEANYPNRAYNRRRRADEYMRKAKRLVGDKGLPWGVR